jgi:hypothetical protein
MPRKRSLEDEELEEHTRLVVEQLAASSTRALDAIGKLLNRWHYMLKGKDESFPLKPSILTPFAILFLAAGLYYFTKIDSPFSPSAIIYVFSFLILIGVYIIRRA